MATLKERMQRLERAFAIEASRAAEYLELRRVFRASGDAVREASLDLDHARAQYGNAAAAAEDVQTDTACAIWAARVEVAKLEFSQAREQHHLAWRLAMDFETETTRLVAEAWEKGTESDGG